MPNPIKVKRSETSTNVPTLSYGEIGVNIPDKKIYIGDSSNNAALIVDGNITKPDAVAGASYVVRGKKTTNQTVTAGSDAVITFDDDIDPNEWWNTSTNRFTPNIPGYYLINLTVWWVAAEVSNNQSNIQFRKNGSAYAISQEQLLTGSGYTQQISTIVYLDGVTDYIDFTAYTSNSPSQNIQGGGNMGTFFDASLTGGVGGANYGMVLATTYNMIRP